MPNSLNRAGNTLSAPDVLIKNAKNASLRQLPNGFVISLQNVDSYGDTQYVSVTLEDAIALIQKYLEEAPASQA